MNPATTPTEIEERELGAESEPEERQMSRHDRAVKAFVSHFKRCPVAEGKVDLGRIESFIVTAPAIRDPHSDGIAVASRKVRVTRCVECGGHEVNDPRGESFREELSAEDDEEI
jgi:hypothetical protein